MQILRTTCPLSEVGLIQGTGYLNERRPPHRIYIKSLYYASKLFCLTTHITSLLRPLCTMAHKAAFMASPICHQLRSTPFNIPVSMQFLHTTFTEGARNIFLWLTDKHQIK